MQPELYEQLFKIYDDLSSCWLVLRSSMYNGPNEAIEQAALKHLNKLLNIFNTNQEFKGLVYSVQEAMNNFDLEYILDKLEEILEILEA